MIGCLICLAVLSLIALLPCGIYAHYSADNIAARLIIGPLRINLLKPKGSKENKREPQKQEKKFESHEKVKGKGKLVDFLPIAKLIFDFLSEFRRKLKINDLQFKLILGGSDPYTISLNYGRYWAALGNLMPHLESWFVIKKRNLEIECDYCASDTTVNASIDLRMSLFTLLHMVIKHGIRIFTKYFKISKQTKDGAAL